MSILPCLSDTWVLYLEYLTEDTFKSIFPNPALMAKKRGHRFLACFWLVDHYSLLKGHPGALDIETGQLVPKVIVEVGELLSG